MKTAFNNKPPQKKKKKIVSLILKFNVDIYLNLIEKSNIINAQKKKKKSLIPKFNPFILCLTFTCPAIFFPSMAAWDVIKDKREQGEERIAVWLYSRLERCNHDNYI